jgi:hypothetical protein
MLLFNSAWRLVYGDEEDAAAKAAADKAAADKAAAAANGDKITMTQDELNKMMADNRRKLTTQNQELVEQLKKMRDETQMTAQQKDELELRIEQIQEQYMSKEELAKREAAKQSKVHQKAVETLTGERDSWRKMYSESTIERALYDASVKGEAVRPEQIVAMLGQTTHLSEVLDAAGHPTGAYAPTVKFNDVDADGKAVTLELAPEDAIKRMKELPEAYGNLFRGTASGGLGEAGGGKGGEKSASIKEITSDPEKYRKWRKENPDLDISKLRP